MKSVRLMHALCRRVQHTFLARRRDVEQRRHYAEKCDSVIKGVVVGVYAKEVDRQPKMTPSGEKFDDRVQGKITDLIRETGLSGQLGKGRVFMNVDAEFRAVAVVGVGQEGAGFNDLEMTDEGMENARVAAGVGARSLQLQGCTDVFVKSMEYAEQAAEGSALAVWRYNTNKRRRDRTLIPKLELYDSPDSDAWMRGLFKAESQNLARRLADTPANQMTPTIFAQSTVDALCPCGVSVEVRSMDRVQELEQLLDGGQGQLRAADHLGNRLLRHRTRGQAHPPAGQGHHIQQRRPLPPSQGLLVHVPRLHVRCSRLRGRHPSRRCAIAAPKHNGTAAAVREYALRNGGQAWRRGVPPQWQNSRLRGRQQGWCDGHGRSLALRPDDLQAAHGRAHCYSGLRRLPSAGRSSSRDFQQFELRLQAVRECRCP
ncbi:cytosol aminopeptidase-like [Drosophila miranda]|uniref:cytosol aminopeptidase-like n=1 Tax=Drosophila miranda TaxID=7229 RepID=UPI00143F343E|nr:cytosol aminopeptidase-like [Drosophila miranda]